MKHQIIVRYSNPRRPQPAADDAPAQVHRRCAGGRACNVPCEINVLVTG